MNYLAEVFRPALLLLALVFCFAAFSVIFEQGTDEMAGQIRLVAGQKG